MSGLAVYWTVGAVLVIALTVLLYWPDLRGKDRVSSRVEPRQYGSHAEQLAFVVDRYVRGWESIDWLEDRIDAIVRGENRPISHADAVLKSLYSR